MADDGASQPSTEVTSRWTAGIRAGAFGNYLPVTSAEARQRFFGIVLDGLREAEITTLLATPTTRDDVRQVWRIVAASVVGARRTGEIPLLIRGKAGRINQLDNLFDSLILFKPPGTKGSELCNYAVNRTSRFYDPQGALGARNVVRHADGTRRLPRARDHLGRVAGRSVSISSSMMVVNGVAPSGCVGSGVGLSVRVGFWRRRCIRVVNSAAARPKPRLRSCYQYQSGNSCRSSTAATGRPDCGNQASSSTPPGAADLQATPSSSCSWTSAPTS